MMPIADNIEYIRSQKKMFEGILAREQSADDERADELAGINRELSELYSQIRTLRAELVAPGNSPSASVIEERIRAEAKVRELEAVQIVFEEAIQRFEDLRAQPKKS